MAKGKNEEIAILEEEEEEDDGVLVKKKRMKRRGTFDDGDVEITSSRRRRSNDPMEVLGREIMIIIMSKLDARSVALSLLVSRSWLAVASTDALWTPKCEELRDGKAHIPRVSQTRGLSRLAAYSLSVMDGKRIRITKEDLCDHAWEFHFNKGAPEYWLNLDPYWKGTGPPMRRYFHLDGSQAADSGDSVWGGHESCYLIVTSFIADGRMREHYVRINRWPRLLVTRKQDWSWEMSNNLFSYSIIPDSNKKGETGPLYHCYLRSEQNMTWFVC